MVIKSDWALISNHFLHLVLPVLGIVLCVVQERVQFSIRWSWFLMVVLDWHRWQRASLLLLPATVAHVQWLVRWPVIALWDLRCVTHLASLFAVERIFYFKVAWSNLRFVALCLVSVELTLLDMTLWIALVMTLITAYMSRLLLSLIRRVISPPQRCNIMWSQCDIRYRHLALIPQGNIWAELLTILNQASRLNKVIFYGDA